MKEISLEETTNTHKLNASSIEKINENGMTITLKVTGKGIVSHGEHGTIITESENIIKYVQREFNPVTKNLDYAYD